MKYGRLGGSGVLAPNAGCLNPNAAGHCAGEYIAVEKLETDYSDTDVVEQIW